MLNKTGSSSQQITMGGPAKDQSIAATAKDQSVAATAKNLEETKEVSQSDFLAGLGIDAKNRTMQARHSL